MDRVPAIIRLNRVNRRMVTGRFVSSAKLRRAVTEVDDAIVALEALPVSPSRLIDVAKAYQLKSSLLLRLGDTDPALDAASAAEDLFKRAGGTSEDYGRFLHDFAVVMHELSVPELPLRYALRAAEVLAPYGSHYRRDLARYIDLLREGTETTSTEQLATRRAALAQARRSDRAPAAQALALGLLASGQARSCVEELHQAMKTAFDLSMKQHRREGLEPPLAVLMLVIELYWEHVALPPWIPEAIERARSAARSAGRDDLEADLFALEAVWLSSAANKAAGMDAALRGVSLHDKLTLRTETSVVRMLKGRINQYARLFALEAAVDSGDPTLVAELIESSRLQVVPCEGRSPTPGETRIAGLRRISVGGVSRLAAEGEADVLELNDTIDAVGGASATWFGAWSSNERIFWALRLRGQWSCGAHALSPDSPLTELLTTAWTASPLTPATSGDELLRGPWCVSAASEEAQSLALGLALLPAALRQALDDAYFDGRPLSLVIAGNILALLPVGVLAYARDGRVARRVLEAAVVRVAPPAVLVARIVDGSQPRSELHPLHVACVDPRDDLTHSRARPVGAVTALGGAIASRDAPATREALLHALSSLHPGEPGLFYFSGHADGGRGDDEDALALADGQTLSAQAIFALDGLSFPARVMLSACSSSGAMGAGGGEWLGLTAAMIWRGARQVIATNWPIWDSRFTSEFDHGLAQRLQAGTDPAVALRSAQLHALNRWRSCDDDLRDFADTEFPLIWAAYSCIGVTD
jgi:hypothetical protein